MLTLIATLCFLWDPTICSKVTISLQDDISMMQCFTGAQPTVIEYLKQHPYVEYSGRTYNITNFSLDRLTCTPGNQNPDKGF